MINRRFVRVFLVCSSPTTSIWCLYFRSCSFAFFSLAFLWCGQQLRIHWHLYEPLRLFLGVCLWCFFSYHYSLLLCLWLHVHCGANKTRSPWHCLPVDTVSSCVRCHWTSAGRLSANRSCRNDLALKPLLLVASRPGRPPTTGACQRSVGTSRRPLRDTNTTRLWRNSWKEKFIWIHV